MKPSFQRLTKLNIPFKNPQLIKSSIVKYNLQFLQKRDFFSPKDLVEKTLNQLNPFQTSTSTNPKTQNETSNSSNSSNYTLKHYQERILPYSPSQVYKVISGCENYHKFLPYCTYSDAYNIRRTEYGMRFDSKLTISFLNFKESYTSDVKCFEPYKVESENKDSGLFKHLISIWEIEPYSGGTKLRLSIEFELNSKVHYHVVKTSLNTIASELVNAFLKRCKEVC